VLEEFAHAVTDSRPYFIPAEEMIHGASVTETVVKSAASHQIEKVA
jgi:hypothetical protein